MHQKLASNTWDLNKFELLFLPKYLLFSVGNREIKQQPKNADNSNKATIKRVAMD